LITPAYAAANGCRKHGRRDVIGSSPHALVEATTSFVLLAGMPAMADSEVDSKGATRPLAKTGRQLDARLAVAFAAMPSIVLLWFHARRYLPFIADDSLISLRYSARLVAGEGLTWNDGERVEGFSNLSWVLANALLHLLGLELITASRILGVASTCAMLWCIVASEPGSAARGLLAGGLAACAVALSGPIAVWAVGGLEQPFVALFLAAALLFCRALLEGSTAARSWAACSLAALCLSRPDGPLLTAAIIVGFLLARGVSIGALAARLRDAFGLGLPSGIAVLGQLAFRLLYYRDWVPNTARAKLALTPERLASGRDYLWHGLESAWPLLAIAVVGLIAGRAFKRTLLVVWVPLVLWSAYVVFIGGDIFPGRRHIVPLVVLLGMLSASGVSAALARVAKPWLVAGSCGLLICWQFGVAREDPENRRAIEERWEWDGEVVGKLLRRAFGDAHALLAVDPAGCIPFFSGLPSIDMLGLNDAWLARHPPADLGRGLLGHELGNGDYVYRRQPDLVLMCSPSGDRYGRACFRSGIELLRRSDFHRDYSLVRFEGREPRTVGSSIWTRKRGRIGIQAGASEVQVPGFLLAAYGGVAALDEQGRLGAELPAYADVRLPLPVPCPQCSVRYEGLPGASVELESPAVLHVRTDRRTHVRRVALTRR
jgi:arabinofuranosyltransferase